MALLPSSRLTPCPACDELVLAGSARCPHCDKNLSERTGTTCSAALLWSTLSLSGCVVTAVYGVPTTDTTTTTTAATDSDSTLATEGTSGSTAPTSSATGTGTDSATETGTGSSGTGQTDTGSSGSGSSGSGSSGSTTVEPLYGAAMDPDR